MAYTFNRSLGHPEIAINTIRVGAPAAGTPTVIDVTPPTYAELRDLLRIHGHSQRVGNKMIHLADVAFREQETAPPTTRYLLYTLFFLVLVGNLVWVLTSIWK